MMCAVSCNRQGGEVQAAGTRFAALCQGICISTRRPLSCGKEIQTLCLKGGVMRISRLVYLLCLLMMACLLDRAAADEPAEFSDDQRAKHLAHMKDLAASIRLLADPEREE